MDLYADSGGTSISLYAGMEGLDLLKESWTRLFQRSTKPAYYQDWRWMFSIVKWLVNDPIYFLAARKKGETVLILPIQLRQKKWRGLRHQFISLPTHNHIVLSDLVVDQELVDSKIFRLALDCLENLDKFKWSYLHLNGVCENSNLYRLVKACGLDAVESSANAYFDLSSDRFDERLSKKFIKNIRRLGKRAENEKGPVHCSYIRDRAALKGAYEAFLSLEASGWKGADGKATAIMHNPQLISFYRELLDQFSEDNLFQINLLDIGGVPAAGQLCIGTGNTWFILKIGYSENLKEYGAGNLLMLNFLEHLDAEGSTLELNLVTAPVWSGRWHLERRSVYYVRHYSSNMKGKVAKAMAGVKKQFNT